MLLEVVATICAALPFGFIVAALCSLYVEGWLKFPAVWTAFAILLLLSFLWCRVVFNTERRALLAALFTVALCVACLRTDWIVETQYSHMGNMSLASYYPPPSPFWSPPRPELLAPGATSWNDYRFFYGGGAGGPVGEPTLKVSWTGVTFGLAAFTMVPVMVISGILKLAAKGQRWRTRSA
ncbi:MAG TPA: hypothetical protein VGE67_14215 [Haloferula sp.]